MMTRVSITGVTGFVGRNLVPFLKDHKVVVNPIGREKLQLISSADLNQADVVIHMAGKAHDLKKVSDPGEYYEVNFELTKKIYDAFLVSTASKFIFISSVKASADQVNGVLTEETQASPQTDYGKSKRMAEQYIEEQPLPDGKSYYILRPCMIHGPGNKGNLNLLYKVVQKGIPYPLAAFDNKRSFLSIENLSFIINELVFQKDILSGIYQVADDQVLSTGEVVKILAASLTKKPRLWKISPALIKCIAKLGDKLHLPLTTERLVKLTESYVVSNEKLKKAINKSLPLSAKEGLEITALSFRNP